METKSVHPKNRRERKYGEQFFAPAIFFSILFLPGISFAQNTFPCDGKMYFFSEDNNVVKLISIDKYATGNPVSKTECTLPALETGVNGLGANPVDGYLYFLEKKPSGNTAIRKIDSKCNLSTACPATNNPPVPFANNGCFDHLGRYWMIENNELMAWNINTCKIVKGPFNVGNNWSNDIVFNTRDCFFYTGTIKIDTSGNRSNLAGPGLGGPGIAMGVDGNIYSVGGGNKDSAEIKKYTIPGTTSTTIGYAKPGTIGGSDMASFPCYSVNANFITASTPGCAPVTVTFTDNSTGLITSWLWEFGDGSTSTLQNPSHIYTTPGVYTVKLTVKATSNCLFVPDGILTKIITIPFSASIGGVAHNVCNGGNNGTATVSISSGSTPYTFAWSPSGGTDSIATGLTAGTYTVTVSDASGCSSTQSLTITQPSAISNTLTPQLVACTGDSTGSATVLTTGGTSPYTYAWSGVSGSGTQVSGLKAGGYTVTVTDSSGCTKTDVVNIVQSPLLLGISIGNIKDVTCTGSNNGSATITASNGTSPYTYLWSNGQTTPASSNLSGGTYTITITDAFGCIKTDTVNVKESAIKLSAATNGIVPVTCTGNQNGSATVTVSNGTSPYTYLWSNGQSQPIATGLSGGTYTITIRDAYGCDTTFTVPVNESPVKFSANTNNVPVSCTGSSDGTATVTALNGTSPYTYLWSGGQSTPVVSGLSGGIYTVTIRDLYGCDTVLSVTVLESPGLLTAGISGSTSVTCKGNGNGSATVTAGSGTAPYTYLWNNGQTTTSISGLSGGTYTITVTDNFGCSKTDTITIQEPGSLPGANIAVTDEGCSGGQNGTATATASGGTGPYSYLWSTGSTLTTLTGIPGGTYTVTVTDANGCTVTSSGVVNSLPGTTAGFTADPPSGLIPMNVNFTNTSTGGTTYRWLFGDGSTDSTFNSNHIYTVPGEYKVALIVTNAYGCTDTSWFTIIVKEKSSICVPNIFTPNHDGSNDKFDICGEGLVVIEGIIYNRWGMALYTWDTPKGGWDGRSNSGEEVPDGVYYYFIHARGSDSVDYFAYGFLTLIREKKQ